MNKLKNLIQLCIPGGNYEQGDESLEDIAMRECKEEMGIILSKNELSLFQNNILMDKKTNTPKL